MLETLKEEKEEIKEMVKDELKSLFE